MTLEHPRMDTHLFISHFSHQKHRKGACQASGSMSG